MTVDNDTINDDDPEMITDVDLNGVVGGRRTTPTTVTGKLVGNDTIVGIDGVNNDTLFAGSGDDDRFGSGKFKLKK